MKCLLAVFALAALLSVAVPSRADEVPHLEFVSELRARYPDLALEYLDKLSKSNPSPDVAAVIPLELAKVHLDLASAEIDANRRLVLYDKARQEFQQFIDKNPSNVLVADARVDLARVTALQAKAQLTRARVDRIERAGLGSEQELRAGEAETSAHRAVGSEAKPYTCDRTRRPALKRHRMLRNRLRRRQHGFRKE